MFGLSGALESREDLKKILKLLSEHPKVVAVYLFGSYAKGEERPMSDIDIAVILKRPTSRDEGDIGSLYSKDIDLVLFHRLPLYIQHEVFKYGRELLVKDEEELVRVKLRVMRGYLEMERLYRLLEGEILK